MHSLKKIYKNKNFTRNLKMILNFCFHHSFKHKKLRNLKKNNYKQIFNHKVIAFFKKLSKRSFYLEL